MTATEMLVVPGTVRARIVDDRVSRAQPSVFDALATSALAIGLGLIAALPTGGSSLGVAAVVTTAGLAGVALEGYLVHDAVRRYQVEKAAGGTDPDKARALAQEEPSLFWLAVTIVGAGLGGAATLQTFRDVARIRRAALASEESGQLVERLRELQRLSEESRFSPDVGARLTAQILDEHASVDMAVEARRLLGSGTRSRQPLSEEELESAVAYAEELGMSQSKIAPYRSDETVSWGQAFGEERLFIGDDLKAAIPDGRPLSANQRVSARGAIAHELVGHRESTLAGRAMRPQDYETWSNLSPEEQLRLVNLDEAQASLRAAKFAPGLTNRERKILFKDAEERLAKICLTADDIPDIDFYLHERMPKVQ